MNKNLNGNMVLSESDPPTSAVSLQDDTMKFLRVFLLASSVLAGPLSKRAKGPKIILDNDWGTADFTIYLLALDYGWDVLGLASGTANTWSKQSSLHALATLERGGLSSCIPVYKGADYPLLNTPDLFHAWEELHGPLVWQGAFAPENANAEAHGSNPTKGDPTRVIKDAFIEGFPNGTVAGNYSAAWMVEQVHKYPGEITIYAAGALTNIALAVRMDPEFASLTKGLVIMGGYLDVNLSQVTGSLVQATINMDVRLLTAPRINKH